MGLTTRWEAECDEPIDWESVDLDGSEASVASTDPASASTPASVAKFPLGDKEKLKDVRKMLALTARKTYDKSSGEGWPWKHKSKKPPNMCGTGQFLAHFSYLSYSMDVRVPSDFGLRQRIPPAEDAGISAMVPLHSACESGQAEIVSAIGKSYGKGALTLKLRNSTNASLQVIVPAGTIFEHISWIHHQNLLVARAVLFRLGPGEELQQRIGAHCMNLSCACSANDPMHLTGLFFDSKEILQSQSKVWDHFEGLFAKYRQESGVEQKGKKGKKGKR